MCKVMIAIAMINAVVFLMAVSFLGTIVYAITNCKAQTIFESVPNTNISP